MNADVDEHLLNSQGLFVVQPMPQGLPQRPPVQLSSEDSELMNDLAISNDNDDADDDAANNDDDENESPADEDEMDPSLSTPDTTPTPNSSSIAALEA